MQESALRGGEGELVSVCIEVEPRRVEELLDSLAHLDFPINPELRHAPACVEVEFPAWSSRIGQVREVLAACGFERARVHRELACATSQAGR